MTIQKNLPYARQAISSVDIQEVAGALSETTITRGAQVVAFERAIAQYCGARYGVAFNSGTAALSAACHAANLGAHDRLITTPNTFIATAAPAAHCRASTIFVDIDCTTGSLDLEQLEPNLKNHSSRGRTFILPVHFAGIPIDMQRLDGMIIDPDTVVIEDAAHALGSSYPDGQKVGCCAWSQMTVFSFHPAKTITTGEGGMVMTNDEDLLHRLRRFRNNGIEQDPKYLEKEAEPGYYEVVEVSGNYNFTEFQAALGLSQLRRLDQFVAKRRQLIATYRSLLRGVPHINMLTSKHDSQSAFHLCVAQIDFASYNTTRLHVMNKLKDKGIGSQIHYIPLYRHPFFENKSGAIHEYFPQMEKYYAQALSLPLYYDLSLDDVEYVVQTLKNVLNTELQKNSNRNKNPHAYARR